MRHPNSKTNQPKFWQILSPKNSFAKTSSALFRHLPEYLEGRTPKKNTLSFFKRNFTPAKSEMQGVFSLGLPRLCEAVAERYERTRQFRATTRSARAISRHQGCFQNTFELCTMNTASFKTFSFRDGFKTCGGYEIRTHDGFPHTRFLPHMAEEVGFEPTVPFLIHRLSRSAHSTTLALLRYMQGLQFTIQSLRSCVNWEQSRVLGHYANPPITLAL